MNKKRLMLTVLFLLTIFLTLPALAGEEKVSASRCEIPEAAMMYMFPDEAPEGMNTDWDIGGVSRLYYGEGADRQMEYINQMDITFVSGDESLKDAAQVGGGTYVNGINFCFIGFDQGIPVQRPTKAVYHVHMESDHYFWEQDVTIYCLPWKGYEAFRIPDSEGFVYYYDPSQEELAASRVFESCMNVSLNELENRLKSCFPDLEDESIQMFNILLATPDYWTHFAEVRDLDKSPVDGLIIKGMGIDIRLPLKAEVSPYVVYGETTAAAGDTIHLALEETDGAGRNFTWSVSGQGVELTESSNSGADIHVAENASGSFSVIATPDDGGSSVVKEITIGGARKRTSFGKLTGKETVNADLRTGDWQHPWTFLDKIIYAPSTMPEGLRADDSLSTIRLYPKGKNDNKQTPDAGTLEFISGDESLRHALAFRLPAEDENDHNIYLTADLNSRTKPGEAVFRLRLKAGNLYYEREFTFRVLSWEEYPLFEFRNPDRSGTAEKGEGPELTDSFGNVAEYYRSPGNNTHLYTKDQVAAMLINDHSAEVAGRLLTDEQIQAVNEYKTKGSLYEVFADQEDGGADCYPQKNLWCGLNINTDEEAFQFREEGEYRFSVYSEISNIQIEGMLTVRVLPYKLTGPSSLMPGESGTYMVRDDKPETGRTFSLSAEGEGIAFDAESGTLTVAEDTPEGTQFTVAASPSDGNSGVYLTGKVSSGLISSEEFRLEPAGDGFSIPLPADTEKYTYDSGACYTTDESAPAYICISYKADPLDEFAEDRQVADKCYDYSDLSKYPEYQEEEVALGEHHARITVCRANYRNEDYSLGYLQYARNNRVMRIAVYSMPRNGTGWDELPKVTLGDMRKLAELIEYDPSQAPITVEDGKIILSSKEGTDVVTAGKKLTVLAQFANPEKVNKKAKNDTVVWSVADPETGTTPEDVKIDAKGVLSAGKQIAEVLKVEVTASSPIFHTSAVFPVTIIPAAKSITLEPAEIFFYTGTDSAVAVKAKIDPDTVPPMGITWTPAKKDIVEITPDGENGTAVIRPLAAGKTTIQVKEPGGKNAKLTVSVTAPVEDLELAVSGKAVPGGTVTVKETLSPKQAGNKTVEWSLDVGEDIATMSNGKLKIAKTTPAGTVITVTCTALGAPEPVVRTVRIEVAEK